jgi:hypothetical protein
MIERHVSATTSGSATMTFAGHAMELGGAYGLLPVDIKFASDGNARQWRR